jgi:hypothetical protein
MTSATEHSPAQSADTRRMHSAMTGTPLEGSTGLARAHAARTRFGHPRIVVELAWEGSSVEVEVGYRWPGEHGLRIVVGESQIRYALWDAVIEAIADGTGLNPAMIADDEQVRGELTALLRALD